METGTLKELNVQPGDVVECVALGNPANRHYVSVGKHYEVNHDCSYTDDEGDACFGFSEKFRIISRSAPQPDLTGPVRTVTRNEIISGEYGKVIVSGVGKVWMRDCNTADELRAAIATLTQIADALDDQT